MFGHWQEHTILAVRFLCDTLNVYVQDMKAYIWLDNITKVMLSRSAQSLVGPSQGLRSSAQESAVRLYLTVKQ